MGSSDGYDQFVVLAIGLLVLLAPALIIVLMISFLSITGDLVLGRLSLLEFLELYLIEFVAFSLIAYGLYRLTLRLVEQRLPASLDAIDRTDAESDDDDAGPADTEQ